jgi:ABC-type nitrate/sulfonate/bicarbonate transport system permease component
VTATVTGPTGQLAAASAPTGAGRRHRRGARGELPLLRGLLPLVAGLLLWELLQREPSAYFPRPSLWADAIAVLWQQDVLLPAIVATLRTFGLALVLATAIGTLVGTLVGRSTLADKLLGPLFEFCRVLPPAAIVPLAVLFAGYTENMKLTVVVFAAIWPVLLQVRSSARALEEVRLEMGRSLRLSRLQSARKILFPSLLPAILLGVRVAAPSVLIIVLLVEIITQVPGLGGLIITAQRNFLSAQVYGLVAIAGVLGLVVNVLVSLLEGVALRYMPR